MESLNPLRHRSQISIEKGYLKIKKSDPKKAHAKKEGL